MAAGFQTAPPGVQTDARGLPARPPAPNPLLNPSQPLSGNALLQAAQALTNSQVQGPLAQLQQQLAQNSRQGAGAQAKTSQNFNALGRQVQSGVNQQGQIAGNLNTQLQGIGADTQSKIAGFGQQAQSGALANMGAQGLDGGALGNLAAQIARQQGTAAQNAGNFQAHGAVQGANYRSLAASNLGTYGLRGQERLGQIAQATRLAAEPINSKIASLQASKGALLASNEGKLRQQEINNAITTAGLGIKQSAVQATLSNAQLAAATSAANNANTNSTSAANNAANNATSSANNAATNATSTSNTAANNATRQQIAAANNAARAAGRAPVYTPTGQRAGTPQQQQRVFGAVDGARALIPQMQQPLSAQSASKLGLPAGTKLSGDQIRQALATGQTPNHVRYTPAEIDAAFALAGWGYLTNAQIVGLNKQGVIVGNRYRRGNVPQNLTPSQLAQMGLSSGSLTQ